MKYNQIIAKEDEASDLYHDNVKGKSANDLYHDNVKSGKNYNDYKGIQIHNLRKELKRVRKILLNLQDIEGKDNSSDMVNDIRNMLGGYEQMVDNMESAFDKLEIGRHRKESVGESDHTISSRQNYNLSDKGGKQKTNYTQHIRDYEHGKGLSTLTTAQQQDGSTSSRFIMPGGSGVETKNGVEKKIQMKGPQSWAYDKPKVNASKKVKEEKVEVDNEGNIAGYLATIDEYVEMLFKHNPEDMTSKFKNEMVYRIQNAVDDIRTRELKMKPSLIRAKYANESMSDDLKLADADRDDFRFEPNNRRHDDTLNEYSPKQIRMAFGILNDPRYRDGNYDGAYAAIEKLAKGLASHPSVAKALKRANESIIKEIDPSRSPWTLSGKHPGAMTKKELKREIAVFDELVARGDHLSPKEMMQLDSLWNYLDSDRVEEDKKREAYHIAEKAKWIKGKREK